MRKLLIPMLVFMTGNAHALSAPDGAPMEEDFHSCTVQDCGTDTVRKFHLSDSSLSGPTVYGETFYAAEGRQDAFKTMFAPSRIEAVYSPGTGEIYEEFKDYIRTEDGLKLTPDSKIKRAPAGYSDQMSEFEKDNYGVRITTGYQTFQSAVTYRKDTKFIPEVHGSLEPFPTMLGKQPVNITFFGDSITLGANATSIYSPPNQPGYPGLVMAYLSTKYPNMVKFRNNSVGGWNSKDAVKAVNYRVLDKKSDLIVLAFGINDEGYSPEKYKKNMKSLIDKIREKDTAVPILIVSPTRSNPQVIVKKKRSVDGPLLALKELTLEYKSVALADVTSAWDFMLSNKGYLDITGNGLNHPNDFSHRIIADVVLRAVMGKRYQDTLTSSVN